MTKYVELVYSSFGSETRTPASDDDWDRGDTQTTWHVSGAKLVKKTGYKTVPYDGELKQGDTVYCLYAVYSTGDSFGHDEDGSMEFLSVHKTSELAFENKKNLEAGGVEIKHDNGSVEKIYKPWEGYFESLSFITVDQYMLK